MKIFDHIDAFETPSYSVVTIGIFDGVHIGHQAILKRLIEEAKKNDGKSILITFWPHPRFILNKDKDADTLKLLTTFDEKVNLLDALGIDFVLKIPFTPEFSNLSADEFVQKFLIDKIRIKQLFIGYDHHFGNNREGNIDFLHRVAPIHGFQVNEIPKQEIDYVEISSTNIRRALENGEIHLANSLLGRNYSITGKVVNGNKLGKFIGFPTANIEVAESYKQLLGDGAYAVRVDLDNHIYDGMLNVGFKPTIDGAKRTIEAHLFNFDQNIYNEEIKVEFIKALRKEVKFNSIEDLRIQLNRDKEATLKLLR